MTSPGKTPEGAFGKTFKKLTALLASLKPCGGLPMRMAMVRSFAAI